MSKQRRVKPRTGVARTSKPVSKATALPSDKSGTRQKHAPVTDGRPPATLRRSSYVEAVARYEQGFEALQRRDFNRAADLLRSVLNDYPDEKELHERVRLYLNICERQAAPREASPRTVEERVYAATIALNAGRYEDAVEHLRVVLNQQPTHDHAEYMLAVVESARGRRADALGHLQRAVELNPDNRSLALHDPDLEVLRADEGFKDVVDSASMSRGDRRKPVGRARGLR